MVRRNRGITYISGQTAECILDMYRENNYMTRKLLIVLFLCSLVPWIVGNGLLPLLPVYASQLGAAPGLVGAYLSISYLALVLGSLGAGWISNRFQRRKLVLIVAGILSVPAIWLMGEVTSAWQLTALTVLVWFMGGLNLTVLSILAGLFARKEERGRIFGALALTGALGALIGGLSIGAIVDRWGYSTLFATLAVLMALGPLLALLLEDKPGALPERSTQKSGGVMSLGGAFYLAILASSMAGIALFVGRLGTSLAMHGLNFPRAAITSTAAVGGLIALPLTPLVGWLSDRYNRKLLLMLCYFACACGLATLAISTSFWHFWIASSLLSIQAYAGSGIGSALIADLVPAASLDTGLSIFSSAQFVGGIAGFALAGLAIQQYGSNNTFDGSALVGLAAIGVLAMVRHHQHMTQIREAEAEIS